MAAVNIDLQNERNKCDFNVQEVTYFLDGGVKETEERRRLEKHVLDVKELFQDVPEEYMSHKEKYENAIRKAVIFYKTFNDANSESSQQSDKEKARLYSNFKSLLPTAVFKEVSPFSLHFSMFIPTILSLANEEQKARWLKRAQNMEIIGTYAQTELGHGTFIRGLETTATYDSNTEEFILHSPTLTAYKWWPGSLAHTANYCIVMAQLYIKNKNYGIQPFLVQIRDEETHMPLPGIKLGEIGAKFGFNTVNNGFLGFDNHRIPRDRMLMKNAQVLKDGTFKKSPNSKLTYGTMVYVRVVIVALMSKHIARAATIAVRYSAVRRQSQLKPNEPEPQILDYVTQQHKLFIAIASAHAIAASAQWLWNLYDNISKDLEVGKIDNLPELHALACCLKAVSTVDACNLIEKCRLACGGHGYMLSSGFPQMYSNATAACTYEGENTVLMLQTARSLVKAWQEAENGKAFCASMAYLRDKTPINKWENSVEGIVKGFERVAAGKLRLSIASLQRYKKSGLSPEDAWNMTSVQLVATSEAHCRAILIATYKSEIDRTSSSLSEPVKKVLYELVEVYACYWALEKLGDLLLLLGWLCLRRVLRPGATAMEGTAGFFGSQTLFPRPGPPPAEAKVTEISQKFLFLVKRYEQYTGITESDVQEIQRLYEELLTKIRPNAVGLVDAFDFRDEILGSTLGAFDGRVYERLMEEAMKSPLNKEPVNQSFHKYLKPFMQGKL